MEEIGMTITADTLIRDVLCSVPGAAVVFERFGLGCASCMAADMESLSAVASAHDVSVSALLAELDALSGPNASDSAGE
jgi:hybrid cluster-associated redox disulfide protein